jgi:hypothetical protein
MAGGVHSGRFCMVDGQTGVMNWTVNETSTPAATRDSATALMMARFPGIKDWNGTFAANGTPPLTLFPSEEFSFFGFTAPTSDIVGSNGDIVSGSALCDSLGITWNFESADILSYVSSFSGNGPLVRAASAHYEDSSSPQYSAAVGLLLQILGGDDPVVIPNVKTINLTLSAENPSYVDSSTAGWTGRKAGVLDATLDIEFNATDLTPLGSPVIGDSLQFQFYVNDTDSWSFAWWILKDVTNLTCDRNGAIIGYTANFEFNGFDADGNIGYVLRPTDTMAWWGTAPG